MAKSKRKHFLIDSRLPYKELASIARELETEIIISSPNGPEILLDGKAANLV